MELSLKDAAVLMGKTERQIRYMLQQGRLKGKKTGDRWTIQKTDLPLSDGQKQAQAMKQSRLQDVVETALGLDAKNKEKGVRLFSVRDLKAFTEAEKTHRQIMESLGETHQAAVSLRKALVSLCKGYHAFHAREKSSHYADARELAAGAVVDLLACKEPMPALADALELEVLPRLAGLLRKTERGKGA